MPQRKLSHCLRGRLKAWRTPHWFLMGYPAFFIVSTASLLSLSSVTGWPRSTLLKRNSMSSPGSSLCWSMNSGGRVTAMLVPYFMSRRTVLLILWLFFFFALFLVLVSVIASDYILFIHIYLSCVRMRKPVIRYYYKPIRTLGA